MFAVRRHRPLVWRYLENVILSRRHPGELILKFGLPGIVATLFRGLLVFRVPETLLSRILGAVLLAFVASMNSALVHNMSVQIVYGRSGKEG